jgi:RNA polymerase sigma factor (sigma-70 family)
MHKTEAFPDMETGYTKYRALFFDALARLARQGFVVQPGDALDLIHDFFANAWEGLAARYDPACGSAASYVYTAFVRFARQRIIRLRRWGLRLQDLASLTNQVAAEAVLSPLDSRVRNEEVKRLQEALSELPQERRTVLLDYFASGPRSQRHLARKYQVSRYQLHELLLNGFGQLVVRLAARGALPSPDREVAVALWCEGWDLEETAARLGRSVQQVREAQARLKKLLAGILRNKHGGGDSAPPPATVPDSSSP